MEEIEVTLISGRTAQQGVGLELGKTSNQYIDSVSFIELNDRDAETVGVLEDRLVEVTTAHGSVVVRVKTSKGLNQGMAFFPYGLWSNQLFGSQTEGTGMPSFKGIKATIKPAMGKKVSTLDELIKTFEVIK